MCSESEMRIAVFIDLKKAFDVSRNRLLQKMQLIGIIGKSHQWFRSYLTKRLQYMEIDDIRSDLENIEEGVPQGTRLSPDPFNMYINDIHEVELHGKMFLYADDIVIIYCDKSLNNIEVNMNND